MRAWVPARLPEFWGILQQAAAADGIELLRQPDATVAQGMFTHVACAVADHVAKRDYGQHNAGYCAAVLAQVMSVVRNLARRG